MFRTADYMNRILEKLQKNFGNRLLYLGLQGSYGRQDADENSDIDIMVVLDELYVEDMDTYRQIIYGLENAQQSCGFICGKNELEHWNPCEICHLVHGTIDYYGKLEALVPIYTRQDIVNHIKITAGNLYHEICHRYIHASLEQNQLGIDNSYKTVFYILQDLYYLKSGEYVNSKSGLLTLLDGMDAKVLKTAIMLGKGKQLPFDETFRLLIDWCKSVLAAV